MQLQFNWPGFAARVSPWTGQTKRPLIEALFHGLTAPSARDGASEADYHADVQQQIVADLRARGSKIEENLRLLAPMPNRTPYIYDADFVAKPVTPIAQTIVEVKTSLTKLKFDDFDGSEFRRKQFPVLVMANIGGHVMCQISRIANLGLPVGAPLPPLSIMVIYALQGQTYQVIDVPPGDLARLMQLVQ